jgi:hypothetical protein
MFLLIFPVIEQFYAIFSLHYAIQSQKLRTVHFMVNFDRSFDYPKSSS